MTPDRSTGRGATFEVLREAPTLPPTPGARGGPLPPGLALRYGSHLAFELRNDRPTIVANFVTSLDGVVALGEVQTGGGEISGFFEPDRFVMGLLRTLADVVVVGAGTVRNAPNHEWTMRRVSKGHAPEMEAWRRELGLAPQPTTLIVTGSGDIDPAHPALNAADVPVLFLTTGRGAEHLRSVPLANHVRVESVSDSRDVPPAAVVDALRDLGARLALCEGGPHLMADLLSIDAIDELFLTVAPQLIGRAEDVRRLSFIEGFSYPGGAGRWAELVSLRAAGDHLFLREKVKVP